MESLKLLGVVPWWQWVLLSVAFYLLMPWLAHQICARFYPQTLIDPTSRSEILRKSRQGEWPALMTAHLINSGLVGLCIAAGGWLQNAGIGHLYGGPLGWHGWLLLLPQVLLVMVVFDTQFYWMHRMGHAVQPMYRRFHRDHHEERFPDVWTSLKQHPFDYFLTTAMPMAWVVVLPIHEVSWLAALLFANYINIAGHLGYEITPCLPGAITPNGWALQLDPQQRNIGSWVNTVTEHDLHHQLFNKNYSLYFTHWDQWMGTQPDHQPNR